MLLGDPIYTANYAISTLRAQLREEADRVGMEVLERRQDAWARLLATFRVMYAGIEHEALRIPARGGSLVDPASAQVAARWPSTEEVLTSVNSMTTAKPSAEATPASLAPAGEVEPPPHAKPHAHGGWLIQIGAFEGEHEAKQHLTTARLKMPTALAGSEPFIERTQKGNKTIYRGRFSGFNRRSAESACKQLKRRQVEFIAMQNEAP